MTKHGVDNLTIYFLTPRITRSSKAYQVCHIVIGTLRNWTFEVPGRFVYELKFSYQYMQVGVRLRVL